jgi:hypothetical protein
MKSKLKGFVRVLRDVQKSFFLESTKSTENVTLSNGHICTYNMIYKSWIAFKYTYTYIYYNKNNTTYNIGTSSSSYLLSVEPPAQTHMIYSRVLHYIINIYV